MLHECVMTWKHKYCWQSLLWFYAETLLKTKWSAILKYWPQHHMLWRYEANTCCTGVLWGQRSALPLAKVKIFGPIFLLIYKKINPYNNFQCQYTYNTIQYTFYVSEFAFFCISLYVEVTVEKIDNDMSNALQSFLDFHAICMH